MLGGRACKAINETRQGTGLVLIRTTDDAQRKGETEILMKYYELNIPHLIHDGDKADLRLHCDETFRWGAQTEKEYKQVELAIAAISYKGDGWELFAWCDISGYEYWMLRQEETNYIQITVAFTSDEVSQDQIELIAMAMDTAIAEAEAIQNKYSYDPSTPKYT